MHSCESAVNKITLLLRRRHRLPLRRRPLCAAWRSASGHATQPDAGSASVQVHGTGERRAASRRSPASPATRIPTTRAPHRAASGNRPTARRRSCRSSRSAGAPQSARWPSRRRIRISCGLAPARRGPSATATSWATASTSRPTPARRGRTSGLDETGRIGTILVHPTNANIVFACALGRTTGPQQERGVFRTTDGGETWTARALRRPEHRLLGPDDGSRRTRTCSSPACGRSRCTRGPS